MLMVAIFELIIGECYLRVRFWLVRLAVYSRVWNKRTPLNKRSPLENLAKRIIVAPFLPYTMKSGIRP